MEPTPRRSYSGSVFKASSSNGLSGQSFINRALEGSTVAGVCGLTPPSRMTLDSALSILVHVKEWGQYIHPCIRESTRQFLPGPVPVFVSPWLCVCPEGTSSHPVVVVRVDDFESVFVGVIDGLLGGLHHLVEPGLAHAVWVYDGSEGVGFEACYDERSCFVCIFLGQGTQFEMHCEALGGASWYLQNDLT